MVREDVTRRVLADEVKNLGFTTSVLSDAGIGFARSGDRVVVVAVNPEQLVLVSEMYDDDMYEAVFLPTLARWIRETQRIMALAPDVPVTEAMTAAQQVILDDDPLRYAILSQVFAT